jgi:hypothetical protein
MGATPLCGRYDNDSAAGAFRIDLLLLRDMAGRVNAEY